jgi:tetratricopeptide (TPR) repeat protein
MSEARTVPQETRLERLLGFLSRDPGNLALLGDAAQTAFDERAFETCRDLLALHASRTPLSDALRNLEAMNAIAMGDYDNAISMLEALRASSPDTPELRFNLAYAYAMVSAWENSLELLDDAAIAVASRGPMLKVQMLHHLDRLDEALATGAQLAANYPDNQRLMGALATLAMDAGDLTLSKHYAEQGGNNGEALAARGMLDLETGAYADAMELLTAALDEEPRNPRAWIGKGLALLVSGNQQSACSAIEQGAQLFETHLGSWIASGWAHFVSGDPAKSRASFVRARDIDPNFAESHGGLAVLDILDGQIASAERNCEIALRLDPQSLVGILAKTLLLEQGGKGDAARRLREIAMHRKIGPNGQSLAEMLVLFNMGRRPV